MRSLLLRLLRLPLLSVFLYALIHHAVAVGAAELAIRRFAFKDTLVPRSGNLSSTEIYARSLTRRRPTRRSTAQRRQASDQPVVTHNINVGATNAATGSPAGELNWNSDRGVVLADPPGMTLTTDYSPSWAGRADRRINIADSHFSSYPILGFIPWGTGELTLGTGSPNAVVLTGIANPGTGPGDTPTSLGNYVFGGDAPCETDVWSIDYSTGAMTANWVNPDGSTPTVVLITDGSDVIATGDYEAFTAYYAPVEFYPITLIYTAPS